MGSSYPVITNVSRLISAFSQAQRLNRCSSLYGKRAKLNRWSQRCIPSGTEAFAVFAGCNPDWSEKSPAHQFSAAKAARASDLFQILPWIFKPLARSFNSELLDIVGWWLAEFSDA
jgi:hypothetical protein